MAWPGGSPPPAPSAAARRFRDLTVRTVAGLAMAAIALAAILLGPVGVVLMTAAVLAGIATEWHRLIRRGLSTAWAVGGGLYLLFAGFCFCYIYFGPDFDNTNELGRASLFWFLSVVIANDCFAYGVGRWLGGPRLAPRVSPKKTWSGTVGGVAAAGVFGALVGWLLDAGSVAALGAIGFLLGLIAQVGDLAESGIKRQVGVKDTGKLIPGHGGLLDRVDGIAAAAIALALAQASSGTVALQWQ